MISGAADRILVAVDPVDLVRVDVRGASSAVLRVGVGYEPAWQPIRR